MNMGSSQPCQEAETPLSVSADSIASTGRGRWVFEETSLYGRFDGGLVSDTPEPRMGGNAVDGSVPVEPRLKRREVDKVNVVVAVEIEVVATGVARRGGRTGEAVL